MPPKGRFGSVAKAQVVGGDVRCRPRPTPQGLACLTMAHRRIAHASKLFTHSASAASVSATLLYDSSLPCSCVATAMPALGAAGRSTYRAARLVRILAVAQILHLALETACGACRRNAEGAACRRRLERPQVARQWRRRNGRSVRKDLARRDRARSAGFEPRRRSLASRRATTLVIGRVDDRRVTYAMILGSRARSIDGPPMSMFSMASASVQPSCAMVCSNGYRFTTSRSMPSMPCAAITASSSPRRPRRPPCTFGCSVLTRPPMISGKPVTSATSVTSRPASRSAVAVPPVDSSWTRRAARRLARSTTPCLSETLSSARRTGGWVGLGDMFGSSGEMEPYCPHHCTDVPALLVEVVPLQA